MGSRPSFLQRIRGNAEWDGIKSLVGLIVRSMVIPGLYAGIERLRHFQVDWLGLAILFVLVLIAGFLLFPLKKANAGLAQPEETPYKRLTPEEQQPVVDRTFSNEVVDVDGKIFTSCRFYNVKLRFNGRAPCSMLHNNFENISIMTDDARVMASWVFLKGLGLSPQMTIVDDHGKPLTNIKEPKRF